jgi:hypothetical protein
MILKEINLNNERKKYDFFFSVGIFGCSYFKPVMFRWIDRKQWHCVYETMILQMEVEKVHLQVLEHVQHRPKKLSLI